MSSAEDFTQHAERLTSCSRRRNRAYVDFPIPAVYREFTEFITVI